MGGVLRSHVDVRDTALDIAAARHPLVALLRSPDQCWRHLFGIMSTQTDCNALLFLLRASIYAAKSPVICCVRPAASRYNHLPARELNANQPSKQNKYHQILNSIFTPSPSKFFLARCQLHLKQAIINGATLFSRRSLFRAPASQF